MIMHHTKSKGDLGVLKVKLDLVEQGYMLLNPETEHAPFDLVIYKDHVFKTVQVKYRSLNSRGALMVAFRSCYCNTQGTLFKDVPKRLIDIYAVYCPDVDTCYYFDPKDYNKSITLRVNAPSNHQQKGINLAADYEKVP